MARRWVAAGHAVTVICGRGDICGLPDQRVFEAEGIHVRVVGSCYSQKQSFLRRIAAFLFFMLASSIEGLCVRKVDVLFATSTPLTIGIPAMVLKWFKRVPFVFEVRDQWPEVPIEMGYIKNWLLKNLLLWLERCIYKSAAAIVALSPGMADGIRVVLGHVRRPVIVAPNSADIELFHPDIDSSAVRKKMGWQDKFVVLHFGAMGKVNSLEFLIDAAQKMQTYPDVLFVLMGQGKEKQNLTEKVAALNLKNFEIYNPSPKSELPQIVAACDVSTVIIGNHPIIEHNSANKFFDSLAAGKPVLLNYSGWQRLTIEAHQAGFGCRLCDLDDYVKNLLTLYASNDRLREMGSNARRLAEEKFSRDKIALDVLGVINGVVHS